MESLTASQLKDMLMHVAKSVIDSKEQLCEADRNIGDGDHGIGMALGMEAAANELAAKEFTDVYAVFGTVGRTMIKVMGGASGIIFGLLFYAGSKNMQPKSELSTQDFAEVFARALAEIQAKGGAQLGDKTIVDGLQPFVEALQKSQSAGEGFKPLLRAGYAAAEAGKEKSKQYIARFGKAKTLGERAVGFPDAGCVTLTVISRSMCEWADANLAE